jgi:hypothetical protein
MVYKFPAKSTKQFPRARLSMYKSKEILEVTVDRSNAKKLLVGMKDGLEAMEGVKRVRTDMFMDG